MTNPIYKIKDTITSIKSHYARKWLPLLSTNEIRDILYREETSRWYHSTAKEMIKLHRKESYDEEGHGFFC